MANKKNLKQIVKTNKLLKYVPNTLTLCNSLCGFTAILWCLGAYGKNTDALSYLAIAAVIILVAMIFDALDGFAARLFNAASMHGMQMDSLADMVTFGVAPSVLVAILAHRLKDMGHFQMLIVWLGCAMYLGCAALRLATYNVHAIQEKKSDETFYGLPSPGAAAAVCIAVIYLVKDVSDMSQLATKLSYTMPLYAAVLGLLMTSKIKYMHVGRYLANLKNNKLCLIAIVIFLLLVIYQPVITLLIVINLYICSGPIMALFNSSKILRIKKN